MLPILAALIGTGTQLALLSVMVIGVTIAGLLFEQRGAITTSFIVCYALTSFISGYVAGGFNARNEGKNWIRTMLLTATLFPGCALLHRFPLERHRDLLPLISGCPFWHHGCFGVDVGVRFVPARALWYRHWSKLERRSEQPVSRENHPGVRFRKKRGTAPRVSSASSVVYFHSVPSSSRPTLFSRASGTIKSTTSTASSCWCL